VAVGSSVGVSVEVAEGGSGCVEVEVGTIVAVLVCVDEKIERGGMTSKRIKK